MYFFISHRCEESRLWIVIHQLPSKKEVPIGLVSLERFQNTEVLNWSCWIGHLSMAYFYSKSIIIMAAILWFNLDYEFVICMIVKLTHLVIELASPATVRFRFASWTNWNIFSLSLILWYKVFNEKKLLFVSIFFFPLEFNILSLTKALIVISMNLNTSRTKVFLSSASLFVNATLKPIKFASNDKSKSLKFFYFTNDDLHVKIL